MARAIKFLSVCGNGMGSSLIVKMNLEEVLSELKIYGIVESTSVSQAAGMMSSSDVIITSTAFIKGIESALPADKPVILVKNLLDKKELTDALRIMVKENFPDRMG